MTMKIVDREGNRPEPTVKAMTEMHRGEICYSLGSERYVMKICSVTGEEINPVFLVLNNDSNICFYHGNTTDNERVRELYPDESITIKFS